MSRQLALIARKSGDDKENNWIWVAGLFGGEGTLRKDISSRKRLSGKAG